MYETPTGTCEFCQSPCLECNGAALSCEVCVSGYFLSSSVCQQCSTFSDGCILCNGTAQTDCLTCSIAYYLDPSNQCQLC